MRPRASVDFDRRSRRGRARERFGHVGEQGSQPAAALVVGESAGETRLVLFQVWEFRGPIYELSLYLVEDRGAAECTTRVMRARSYAIGIEHLMELMQQAGFAAVERIDGQFFQPLVAGTRPVASSCWSGPKTML